MAGFEPSLNPLWFASDVRVDAGLFAAIALRTSYTGRADLMQTCCNAVNTPAKIQEVITGEAILPRVIYCEFNQGIVVIFRGTTKEIQLLLQIVGAGLDVVGPGPMTTNVVWRNAGQAAFDLLTPLLRRTSKPICFVGHSYGAATALVAAALALPLFSTRMRTVYVIGCPKTGNGPFGGAIGQYVKRFENVADPVVMLPPPTITRVLIDPLAITPLVRFVDYRHCGMAYTLDGDGVCTSGAWSDTMLRGAITAIAEIVRRQTLVEGPHQAGEYTRRLGFAIHQYQSGWQTGWKDFAALFTLDAELTALGVL